VVSFLLVIYLRAEHNRRWGITFSANTKNRNETQGWNKKERKQRKLDPLSLFTFKQEFLKIYLDLQTALVEDTHG
jgi:hypothetical protein